MANPWELNWTQPDTSSSSAKPWEQNWSVPNDAAETKQMEEAAPPASSVPVAISDVPKEIENSAAENVAAIKRGLTPSGQGERGFLERSGDLAKGLLAVPGLAISPITGAARSLIGHPMADAIHATGSVIAPDIAAKDDPQAMYDRAKGDVDLAMAGARPAGQPIRTVNPNSPSLKHDIAPTRAAYEWQTPGTPTVTAPTIPELKAASEAAYSSPEVVGLELKPGALKEYSDRARISLNNDGFDDIVAPKTFALLDRIGKAPPASVVTGQNLNSLRKTLGKVAGGNDPTEVAAASRAIDHLDDFLPNVHPSNVVAGDVGAASAQLEDARANWSAAKQSEKLDKKIQKAQMQADTSNSGMNLENRIRTNMGKVAIEEREARGLRPEEIAQAKQIAEGTKFQNGMRFVGNAMAGGGGIGMAVTGIPTAGIAPAAGVTLKLLSNRMTLAQANRLSEAIRMRAPLASSAEKFGEAFAKYKTSQTPSGYAAMVLAARNLANNLHGTGIELSISNLLRSLSVPGQGSAQDDQDVPRRK